MSRTMNMIDIYSMNYAQLDDEIKKQFSNVITHLLEKMNFFDLISLYIEIETKRRQNNYDIHNLIDKNSLYDELGLQVLLSSNGKKIEKLELYSQILGSWYSYVGSMISKRIKSYGVVENQEMLEQLNNRILSISSQKDQLNLNRLKNYELATNPSELKSMADSLGKTESEMFEQLESEFSELVQKEGELENYLIFYKMFERELSDSLIEKNKNARSV
ncbi:MAG: hypothetical protein IJE89_01625 [Bacilli bacterium]|nr:hypothetical protein [Bacilli bacterium]